MEVVENPSDHAGGPTCYLERSTAYPSAGAAFAELPNAGPRRVQCLHKALPDALDFPRDTLIRSLKNRQLSCQRA